MIPQTSLVMIFRPTFIKFRTSNAKKFLTLIFGCSYFLSSEFFGLNLYRNHNPHVLMYCQMGENIHRATFKTNLVLVATKTCTPTRECWIIMTKLHHLMKLYHHMLYHISHVIVRWRRTSLRRRKTFHTVLHRRWVQSKVFLTCSKTSYDNLRLDISPASTYCDNGLG